MKLGLAGIERTDDAEAIFGELLGAACADEKGDVALRVKEMRAEEAADGSGAYDEDLHRVILFETSATASSSRTVTTLWGLDASRRC